MIVLIDNYDSFTYNIYQYIGMLGFRSKVIRNDKCTLKDLQRLKPTHLIISPGPGEPQSAGLSIDAIRCFSGEIPVLGICLGHQAIACAFGGKVVRAKKLVHGKVSVIKHNKKGLFQNIPSPISVTRYHSLVVSPIDMPACLRINARTEDDVIMGVEHRKWPVFGLQFHPESYMSEHGLTILQNFVTV